MIGTIRKSNISTRGGILAAILIATSFASAQVACLTHTHCDDSGCLEHREAAHAPQAQEHNEHEADHECGRQAGSPCEKVHQARDIRHHSHDGKTHPQRRFAAPILETAIAAAADGGTAGFELASCMPAIDGSPPFERYWLAFAERAPPLS